MQKVVAPARACRTGSLMAYPLAALIGSCWVWAVFPDWALQGELQPGAPTNPDLVQYIVGQRYFWFDGWHFRNLLWARQLDMPYGVMIGFTDSIPLPTLLIKPFASLLPASFQSITLWLALSWVMQPMAAVFALRSAREKRLVPAIAVAACASAMPTFLARFGHVALSSHFTLLLGIGLALRLVDDGMPRQQRLRVLLGSCTLIPALLLIHPYLMMMAIIVLLSAPLTLLLRRDQFWRPVAALLGVSILLTAGLADLLGYVGSADAVSGFGYYSMNLLSPFWPRDSGVLGSAAPAALDATGGQYEGFQYLGAGVLLGAAALLARGRQTMHALKRHPGLLLACVLLCAIAISAQVYLGRRLLLALPAPAFMGVFRVSGRFFWPVAYALLVGMIAVLARAPRRVAAPLLLAMAILQTIDGFALAGQDRTALSAVTPYPFDAARLAHLMRMSQLVNVDPAWPCDATYKTALDLMTVLAVAGRVGVPINTMYTARATHPPQCADSSSAAQPLAPGELRVFLPSRLGLMRLVPDSGTLCRRFGRLGVCSVEIAD